ncbi:Uncharacterised protein [Bordetella pertussis]|nr:Uncharacterised protein [Bordetella pertussis]
MCTSMASKPAVSNAQPISTWLLQPCSRRIATRGRLPVPMNGAATSSCGSNATRGARPGSLASFQTSSSACAQAGLSRRAMMR